MPELSQVFAQGLIVIALNVGFGGLGGFVGFGVVEVGAGVAGVGASVVGVGAGSVVAGVVTVDAASVSLAFSGPFLGSTAGTAKEVAATTRESRLIPNQGEEVGREREEGISASRASGPAPRSGW
jgi:hypothetical protein